MYVLNNATRSTFCKELPSLNTMYSVCIPQKNKLNPFHGLMLLPKPYGVERRVLVFAKVKCIKYTVYLHLI